MNRRLALPGILLMAATLAGACGFGSIGAPAAYQVRAEFPSTIGLYPGSFVRQLGIDVGTVSAVANQADHVLVTMRIRRPTRLSARADAILVGNSVLGERYVQFEPAYTGGPPMAAGTTLPESRVTVPVETDTVLRSLDTVLRGIDPTDVKQFTVNLATVLRGQGAKLNQLIGNAAGTVTLLADKSQDLGRLTTTLAQLTSQLGTRDRALASLITDYDLLSQTLAGDRGQIDAVITQLTDVTTQATGLLAPNLGPIRSDVADLATVGRTLDRNLGALNVGLQYAPRLFTAAGRAYDPLHNWLPLVDQAAPGLTTAVLGANVRDALASICRRLAARNPTLAPTLAACGNPASGFFDPVIGLLPSLLAKLPGAGAASAPAPADATAAFADGIEAIPGLTPAQRRALLAQPRQAGATSPEAASPKTVSGPGAAATPSGTSSGPPGAAAVAALEATPRGSVPAAGGAGLGPPPTLRSAPAPRHRGLLVRFADWVGGLA